MKRPEQPRWRRSEVFIVNFEYRSQFVLVFLFLKLVFAIFYQIFIFSPNHSPSKSMKNVFLYHLKGSFRSQDIQIFVVFFLPFHTFQIQKGK